MSYTGLAFLLKSGNTVYGLLLTADALKILDNFANMRSPATCLAFTDQSGMRCAILVNEIEGIHTVDPSRFAQTHQALFQQTTVSNRSGI